MKAIIFGGADINNYEFYRNYLKDFDFTKVKIICCDRGLLHAHKLRFLPDCIVGDFDSVDKTLLNNYIKKNVYIEKYPSDKNYTDLELGINIAIDKYFVNEIFIIGAIGNRMDHTFSNFHLLYMLTKKNIKSFLIDSNNIISVVNGETLIEGKKGDIISILPFLGDAFGVTLKGFKYPLDNAIMKCGESLGVSNILLDTKGLINVKDGFLIVIKARD